MNPPRDKILRTLRFSFLDGICANVMAGFTQEYWVPFLLLLEGTARHVGILSSLPNFFAAVVQLVSPEVTEKAGSRRRVFTVFVFLQAIALVPIALAAWTSSTPGVGKVSPMIFIFMVTFFAATGSFALPAWGSLMSDLIAPDKRGEYFGWRNRVLGLILVAVTFLAGVILQISRNHDVFLGFAVIFGLACFFRFLSWYFLTRMHEPALELKKEHYFSLYRFLARSKESNFVRFVFFVSLMSFSVNMAAPFFAVFMLRDLQLSYLTYTVLTVTVSITVYLLMGRWGRLADVIGNLAVLRFTAPIIAILPLLWITHHHPVMLVLYQIVSGFAWAGFNLCASNFIFDAVSAEKRTRCISYFNAINGLALCLGALAGGFLIPYLPPLFGYKLLTLFLISSALRLLISLFFPRQIKEVKAVEKISNCRIFSSVLNLPTSGGWGGGRKKCE